MMPVIYLNCTYCISCTCFLYPEQFWPVF